MGGFLSILSLNLCFASVLCTWFSCMSYVPMISGVMFNVFACVLDFL